MNKHSIGLEELSINSLYNEGNIVYEVPIYQRNYAWEKEQIKTLVQDVYDAFKTNEHHSTYYYIGTLVTYKRNEQVYEVIDGQQRLTTIYLLLKRMGLTLSNELSYRSRRRSKDTLLHLNELDKVKNVDEGIQNGYDWAKESLDNLVPESEKENFTQFFLNQVHILRYIVPMDIDLNHYFEVMNSRGEQLEKHEIVKALLCEPLDEVDQKKFCFIWEACSEMNVYIQQKITTHDSPFGKNLTSLPMEEFDGLFTESFPKEAIVGVISEVAEKVAESTSASVSTTEEEAPKEKKAGKVSLKELLKPGTQPASHTQEPTIEKNDQFQPIIDFPNLLLIVLKLTLLRETTAFNPVNFILDDKELINEFRKALSKQKEKKSSSEASNRASDDEAEKEFVKQFASNLLKTKYLLDNFIVHHSNQEDTVSDNPWKLQHWVKARNGEAYAKNTANVLLPNATELSLEEEEKDRSRNGLQSELVMLLSMFEVAFSSRQRKNYLFYCLVHLFQQMDKAATNGTPSIDLEKYREFLQKLARKFMTDIYLNQENLNQSNNRPVPNAFDKALLPKAEENLPKSEEHLHKPEAGLLNLEVQNATLAERKHSFKSIFTDLYGNGVDSACKGIQMFVFHYMDYALWKKYASVLRGQGADKESRVRSTFFEELGCSDLGLKVFEQFYFSRTRNSLEHYYPQNKEKKEQLLSEIQINCFGNYALIGSEANSSGNDWDPVTKLSHYLDGKQNPVSVSSLKFRIMMQMCADNDQKRMRGELDREKKLLWNETDIQTHQEKMLEILNETLKTSDQEKTRN